MALPRSADNQRKCLLVPSVERSPLKEGDPDHHSSCTCDADLVVFSLCAPLLPHLRPGPCRPSSIEGLLAIVGTHVRSLRDLWNSNLSTSPTMWSDPHKHPGITVAVLVMGLALASEVLPSGLQAASHGDWPDRDASPNLLTSQRPHADTVLAASASMAFSSDRCIELHRVAREQAKRKAGEPRGRLIYDLGGNLIRAELCRRQ